MGEPGADRVNELTRAFAVIDARVIGGAGRGPTADEEAAAERAGRAPLSVAWAYREMLDRGAWQQGEGRPGF
jgi:nitrous oxide reductase accessory protein NosL